MTINVKTFDEKKISQDGSFLKKKIRLAEDDYRTAVAFYSIHDYTQARKYFLRSVCHYPFIGKKFWPQEAERVRFSLPYRILKVYILILECMLNTSTNKV